MNTTSPHIQFITHTAGRPALTQSESLYGFIHTITSALKTTISISAIVLPKSVCIQAQSHENLATHHFLFPFYFRVFSAGFVRFTRTLQLNIKTETQFDSIR